MDTNNTPDFYPHPPRRPDRRVNTPLIVALVVAALILAVVIGVAVARGSKDSADAQAHDNTNSQPNAVDSDYADPPAAFLNTMNSILEPKGYHFDPQILVKYAVSVCDEIDNKLENGHISPVYLVNISSWQSLNRDSAGSWISLEDTKTLVQASIAHYCPRYIGLN